MPKTLSSEQMRRERFLRGGAEAREEVTRQSHAAEVARQEAIRHREAQAKEMWDRAAAVVKIQEDEYAARAARAPRYSSSSNPMQAFSFLGKDTSFEQSESTQYDRLTLVVDTLEEDTEMWARNGRTRVEHLRRSGETVVLDRPNLQTRLYFAIQLAENMNMLRYVEEALRRIRTAVTE